VGRARFAWILPCWVALVSGCDGGDAARPPNLDNTFGPGPPIPTCEPPPTPDTSNACAEEVVPLFGRKPIIYFILDTSGSMLDRIPTGEQTKLDAAKSALATVAREIGHRSKYGLAAFPGGNEETSPVGCAPGQEVFAVQEGDPIECVNLPPGGPVLNSFVRQLDRLEAYGGTPLSPSLQALSTELLSAEEQTAVILITDGAPNCNDEIRCEASSCSHSRYGNVLVIGGEAFPCDEETNCCSTETTGFVDAHLACIDEADSVRELKALSESGVPTYVIGVLGSEDFDDVMNELAVAGGRAREGTRKYYDVESLAELTDTVRSIGRDLTQTCTILLEERPPQSDQLNVYFDGELVPSDEEHGWTQAGDVVTLHGNACDQMESGDVDEVQLLLGCNTVVR
jgi:hypothetical protein